MKDFILTQIIQMKFMDGWRTYASGAFFILTGLGLMANQVASGVYDSESFTKAGAWIATGLGLVGLGGKADKITAAMKKE